MILFLLQDLEIYEIYLLVSNYVMQIMNSELSLQLMYDFISLQLMMFVSHTFKLQSIFSWFAVFSRDNEIL